MRFEPIFELPTAWTLTAGRFGLHLFEGRVTLADMERMEVQGAAWYRKNPGKLVELVIIYPSNTRMSSDERSRMARLIKRWERDRVASSTVILATGLLGAMQRSVLTGLLLVVPPPHPSKVFGAVDEAITWLAPHAQTVCGEAATHEVLASAVRAECVRFEARERPV